MYVCTACMGVHGLEYSTSSMSSGPCEFCGATSTFCKKIPPKVINEQSKTIQVVLQAKGVYVTRLGLETALRALKRGTDGVKDCWCEMAIDNPMMKGHSRGCLLARKALNID